MNADGSGITQLAFNIPGKTGSFDHCLSPGGTKILIAHFPSTGWADLFTMNPDGSGVAQVTRTAPILEFDPEWAVGVLYRTWMPVGRSGTWPTRKPVDHLRSRKDVSDLGRVVAS